VAEPLGPDAYWCVYNDPTLKRPAASGKVGQQLAEGETFTIPLEGLVGGLTPFAP
jgi:hypothetical protein